jgi:hypothetical protein
MWSYSAPALLVLLATVSFSPSAQPADLSGAWAGDARFAERCSSKTTAKFLSRRIRSFTVAGLSLKGTEQPARSPTVFRET